MKKYTIQDLKNGNVAVHNNGTTEELREVLKKAFSKDANPQGEFLYYFKRNDNNWDYSDETNLPTQSVKDFLTEYPREMWVWDDDKENKVKELVLGEFLGVYMTRDSFATDSYYSYKNAEDIKEEKVELSLQEIADKFGVNVKCLKIVEK